MVLAGLSKHVIFFSAQSKMKKRHHALLLGIVIFVAVMILLQQTELREGMAFPWNHSLPAGLMKPNLVKGDQFYLKTVNDEYVSVCASCSPIDQNLENKCSRNLCVKPNAVRSSVFTYIPHRDGTFSVRTVEGKYWKRCANCVELCPGIVCADGVNPRLQPSKFVLIKNGDELNSISIKTDTGRLLELHDCSQSCGRIVAALGVGLNRQFVIEKLPPPYQAPQRVRRPTKRFTPPSYAPISIGFQV